MSPQPRRLIKGLQKVFGQFIIALAIKKFFKQLLIVITKAKTPDKSVGDRLSGVALCQRSFGSIVILEKGFEPVVY